MPAACDASHRLSRDRSLLLQIGCIFNIWHRDAGLCHARGMTGLLINPHSNEEFTEHDILKEVEDAHRKARRINRRTKYSREEVDRIVGELLVQAKEKDS